MSQVTTGKYDVALTYSYDLSGRMISESRTENGAATESSYIYDAIGQLTEFTRSDGITENYAYDAAGNMLEKSANGVKTNYTYNAANQLVADGTYNYIYDKIGNLVEKAGNGGQVSYTYNALNLLEKWTDGNETETYTYNAAGLLSTVKTNTSTTALTWDILCGDGVVISEKTNDTVTDYTYGLERISASSKNSRTEYVYDGRGSVIGEVTKSGLLSKANVTTKAYTPFGEQIGEQTSGFGWNGEYYNATTGQVYLRARFYEPEMNRFAQKDILKGSILNGTSLNRYTYCINDPVNYVDINGMAAQKAVTSGPVKSTVPNATAVNAANAAAQARAEAKKAADIASSAAPGSAAAQQAQQAYEQTLQYSRVATATGNPNAAQLAVDSSRDAVEWANRAVNNKTAKSTTTASPSVIYDRKWMYECANNDVIEKSKRGYFISEVNIKKVAQISLDMLNIIYDSLEISAGIGQGLGASGQLNFGDDTIGFSLKTGGNYIEFRLDDGKWEGGMSYSNEAYLGILTAKLGFAHDEISDWKGKNNKDNGSFSFMVPESTLGVYISAYIGIGGSIKVEFNYIEFVNRLIGYCDHSWEANENEE